MALYRVEHTMLSILKPVPAGQLAEENLKAGDIVDESVLGDALERLKSLGAVKKFRVEEDEDQASAPAPAPADNSQKGK